MHFLLVYDVVPDFGARRAAHRAEHLGLVRAAALRGELVLGGSFDPIDGAALLFQGESPAVAERFAASDPYVTSGLVTSWRVRRWTTVVGTDASTHVDGVGAAPRTAAEATRARVVAFLRTARHWVVSTLGPDGAPQSAVVGVAVGDDLALVFDTEGTTRKAANLRRDPRVSLVMWAGAATAQIEGIAEEPGGAAREEAQRAYLATFPDGVERAAWPAITYVRVRPAWVRFTDFGAPAPTTVELDGAAIAALTRPSSG